MNAFVLRPCPPFSKPHPEAYPLGILCLVSKTVIRDVKTCIVFRSEHKFFVFMVENNRYFTPNVCQTHRGYTRPQGLAMYHFLCVRSPGACEVSEIGAASG